MNHAQNKTVHALLHSLQLMQHKENIVLGISNGRTGKSSELDHTESLALIDYLKKEQQEKNATDDAANRMHRKIISMAHQLHWHLPGTQKVDMKSVDEWCIKFGYLHKKLNAYTAKELPKLVTAFSNMHTATIKKL